MPADNAQLLERLGAALALGLLIGLERGWENREAFESGRVAGLRTFGLISLLGGLSVQLGWPEHDLFLSAALLAVVAMMALGYWRETAQQKDVGVTTAIAALVAFTLGAMAGAGHLTIAASAAVVVTLILGFKAELHSFVLGINREELDATFRLLLISVVLLPVLPDKGFGPYASFNPYEVWWMVVLVAGISYVGYFAIKLLGEERGVIVTGLFGGLVSSTAVALTMAPLARQGREERNLVAAAVICASAMMFPRILVIAAVVAPALALPLAWPLGAAAIVSFAAAGWYTSRSRDAEPGDAAHGLEPRNPPDLWFALKFGAMLAAIMILARAAQVLLGNRGLLLFAGISGLVDAAPITLSVSSMLTQGQVKLGEAGVAILAASAVNSLIKPAIVTFIAGLRAALPVWIGMLLALAAGAVAYWATAML